jgi:hypothetical protein
MTGNIPFYNIRKILAIPALVLAGARPQKPDAADPKYQAYGPTERTWSFIETCWQQDADLRPTALELHHRALSSSVACPRPTQQSDDAFLSEFRRQDVLPSSVPSSD